jgi:hypothetical protein
VLHVLSGGLLLFGEARKRGDVLTVTQRDIDAQRDREGRSWCDDLSEAAQLDRWGSIRLGLGPWPEDLAVWTEVGDPVWVEHRERARREAYSQPTAEARDAAVREVRRIYGEAPSTSRTLNAATSSPEIRTAEEQRRRLDAAGPRQVTRYAPPRREG